MLVEIQETDLLIVNDVLPTFMPGGGLAVEHGDEVVPVIRDHIMPFFPRAQRMAIKERHPIGHIALASSFLWLPAWTQLTRAIFEEQIREYGPRNVLAPLAKFTVRDVFDYLDKVGHFTLFPDHAIAGTEEAELHPALSEGDFFYVLTKGLNPLEHAYSAFQGDTGTPTELEDVMRARSFRRVFGAGLALDYCVGWLLVHAADRGFEAYCIDDGCRSVDVPAGNVLRMRQRFVDRGVVTVQSDNLRLAA